MTLFDLVIRSMRKNIKHYYLYFFALIFSVVLYFVFATLQHDSAVIEQAGKSMNFASAFTVAGILLIIIAGIFIVYANAIFLKRRSREIGLYQLIGLTKNAVARLLIIENILLGIGALVVGISVGLLVSRVFLLLLMKLVGYDSFIALSFSVTAVIQTAVVFLAIILLTSLQMLFTVYRNTLLGLFNADKKGEHPKKPRTAISAILALLGIVLIAFGYWLSGNMLNDLILFNMIGVLASTILGTYLVFRVTISWLFYQIRTRKQGHLGLNNSLSIASLMHRMRGNANSLTIITVLSAMTLAMLGGSYSLYYSTEKETRYVMPFDFMFEEDEVTTARSSADISLEEFEAELIENDIQYTADTLEILEAQGTYEKDVFPLWFGEMAGTYDFNILSAQQLQNAGLEYEAPNDGMGIFHSVSLGPMSKEVKTPFEVYLTEKEATLSIAKYAAGDVLNATWSTQIVVNDTEFTELKNGADMKSDLRNVYVVNVPDHQQLAIASSIRRQNVSEGALGYGIDYYSMYERSIQSNGLLIFIAGFLGLVFLISTGSILYFKQMTEAEQEKQSYVTLRQLGFTVKDIMRGIIRKQVFVFGLPLALGLLHSIFAIKAASFLFMSDITVPASVAMGIYALIYLVFAVLTVGYYRKTVKAAL